LDFEAYGGTPELLQQAAFNDLTFPDLGWQRHLCSFPWSTAHDAFRMNPSISVPQATSLTGFTNGFASNVQNQQAYTFNAVNSATIESLPLAAPGNMLATTAFSQNVPVFPDYNYFGQASTSTASVFGGVQIGDFGVLPNVPLEAPDTMIYPTTPNADANAQQTDWPAYAYTQQ